MQSCTYRGTENVLITGSQRYPKRNHENDLAGHSSFLFGNSRVAGTFFQSTSSQWYTQQHRVFTSRVFQIRIFYCDSKGTKVYQRQLEQSSY